MDQHTQLNPIGTAAGSPMAWGSPHPLLDLPLVAAADLAALEDRAAALLRTENDTLIFGAEAAVPLEAVTASLGGPELVWLNVITSPYGRMFADLLRSRGTVVHDLIAPGDRPVAIDQIAAAFRTHPEIGAMAIVHAESLTGIRNPLEEALTLARAHGALTVVDAVASAGAEPLAVDEMEIDVCVIGPQKGWGGPVGASVLTVSERAWEAMRANPASIRRSLLSLLDLKEAWIDAGRTRVIGTPPPLEIAALAAALSRLEAEGIDAVVARHARAAAATRAGLTAMGLQLWAADPDDACAVATPVRMPPGIDCNAVLVAVRDHHRLELTPGTGELAGAALRIDHMGARACSPFVAAAVLALGAVLHREGTPLDVTAGLAAVARTYAGGV